MSKKYLPIIFALILFSVFEIAQTARAAAIQEFVDPSENPALSDEKKADIVRYWLTCIECNGQHVRRLVGFGDDIVGSLKKAYDGDDEFLSLSAQRVAYGASYDSFKNYLTRPPQSGDRAKFIQNEVDRLTTRVRGRAESVLVTIGTPEACAALDPDVCPVRTSPPRRRQRDP